AKEKELLQGLQATAFTPTALVEDHWHGKLLTDAFNELFTIKKKQHFVVGVVSHYPDGLLGYQLPEGATATVVLNRQLDGSVPIRAPALDSKAVPRVTPLCVRQFGATTPHLKWEPQAGKALPTAQATKVLRLACFQDLVNSAAWKKHSSNFKVAATDWLRTLHLPQ
ncbi:unnamed protein product, partial [Prorocentrum cordatum]